MDIGKKYGPQSIPVNILHLIKDEISIPLYKIFNLSMQTGTHPNYLKLVMVIPIHKKDQN